MMYNTMHTILIVENDLTWQNSLAELLRKKDYRTLVVPNGQTALDTLQKTRVSLVLLDLSLEDPNFEGAVVCHEMRALDPRLPIVMISVFGTPENRRTSLDMGADVFFIKGDDEGVLLAQIARLIKRAWSPDPRGPIAPIIVKDLVIDPSQAEVTIKGEKVGLPPHEFDLLLFLASHPGRVVSCKDLLSEVWHVENISDADASIVRTGISRLRKKLNDKADKPTYIFTVQNACYKFYDWRAE